MEDDKYIIDISTMDSNSNYTVTVNASTLSTGYNVSWDDIVDFDNISQPVEFEDEMPSVAKVEDMCRDYPALEKAYENFKTVYKLVHQDWKGRQDENGLSF
jgi:hypothetical protein